MILKTLVADDPIVFRRLIAEVLGSLPDVQVAGTVPNGKLAVQGVRELRPDFLTLVELPEIYGMRMFHVLREGGERVVDFVVPLEAIAGRITAAVRGWNV